MKRFFCIIAILCTAALFGCDKDIPECTCGSGSIDINGTVAPETNPGKVEELQIQQVLDCFVDYAECAKTGNPQRFVDYCHFESQESFELTQRYLETVFSYDILRIEQLSDALWEIEFFYTSSLTSQGMYVVNYVGKIEGEYKIMTSIQNVPEYLKENVIIEPYEPHGPAIISPDDVITG